MAIKANPQPEGSSKDTTSYVTQSWALDGVTQEVPETDEHSQEDSDVHSLQFQHPTFNEEDLDSFMFEYYDLSNLAKNPYISRLVYHRPEYTYFNELIKKRGENKPCQTIITGTSGIGQAHFITSLVRSFNPIR